ncbi:hypothetical protein DRA42_06360 [Ethanoligenens harbinense]|nr:hypothetical protein DRA42_06360 [Ethanoligenens harbinense]
MLTIRYTTTYAREHSTDVYIFSEKQSGELTHYLIDGDFVSPKIKQIYNTQSLVAYEWSAGKVYFITYKEKGSVIQPFSSIQIDAGNFQDANLLYPVAKQQFNTRKWGCINLFAELLLKCNDTEAKATLQRYARGLFTDEEMMQNRGSPITSSDVQEYAAKLISKYP